MHDFVRVHVWPRLVPVSVCGTALYWSAHCMQLERQSVHARFVCSMYARVHVCLNIMGGCVCFSNYDDQAQASAVIAINTFHADLRSLTQVVCFCVHVCVYLCVCMCGRLEAMAHATLMFYIPITSDSVMPAVRTSLPSPLQFSMHRQAATTKPTATQKRNNRSRMV